MQKPFSLITYFGVVILLSWPFQIAYGFLGQPYRPLLLVSMVMAGVATFVCGKWIFKDGFKTAGWSWGKPQYYFYVLLLALVLWAFPSLVEQAMGWYLPKPNKGFSDLAPFFLSSFLLTIIPAFGEEFSWRGYLLPRLLIKYSPRKALLLHGLITWLWHLPVLFTMAVELDGNLFANAIVIFGVSFVPTIMHAVVFAYIWGKSGSLAVVTFYHILFDEIRDTFDETFGFGFFGNYWQMLILILLGIWILKKRNTILAEFFS